MQVSQRPGRGPHCLLECSLGRYIGSIHPILLVRAITAHLYVSGGGINTTSHERTVQSHCRINSTCGETVYYSHLREMRFAAHCSRRAQEDVLLNVTTPSASSSSFTRSLACNPEGSRSLISLEVLVESLLTHSSTALGSPGLPPFLQSPFSPVESRSCTNAAVKLIHLGGGGWREEGICIYVLCK